MNSVFNPTCLSNLKAFTVSLLKVWIYQSVSQSVSSLAPAFSPLTMGGSSVSMVTGMCPGSQGRTSNPPSLQGPTGHIEPQRGSMNRSGFLLFYCILRSSILQKKGQLLQRICSNYTKLFVAQLLRSVLTTLPTLPFSLVSRHIRSPSSLASGPNTQASFSSLPAFAQVPTNTEHGFKLQARTHLSWDRFLNKSTSSHTTAAAHSPLSIPLLWLLYLSASVFCWVPKYYMSPREPLIFIICPRNTCWLTEYPWCHKGKFLGEHKWLLF